MNTKPYKVLPGKYVTRPDVSGGFVCYYQSAADNGPGAWGATAEEAERRTRKYVEERIRQSRGHKPVKVLKNGKWSTK